MNECTVQHTAYLELYTSFLKGQNYSDSTIQQRQGHLLDFFKWLLEVGITCLSEVTLVDLGSYFLSQADKGYSASHRIGKTGTIKSFFRLLYETDLLPEDPSYSLKAPRRGLTLPRGILDIDSILELLSAPDLSTIFGLRDKAILEILYSCGIRNTELRTLALEDINLEERTLWVQGKGSKQGVVPLGRTAVSALEKYLRDKKKGRCYFVRAKMGGPKKKHIGVPGREYVFLSKNGYQLSRTNLADMVKRYAKKIEIDFKYFGPHSIRHTCATHLLKGGADVRHIQKLLRHKHISSTQIYTHVVVEDLREAQRKYHPREVLV